MTPSPRSAKYPLAQVLPVVRLAIIGQRVVNRTSDDYPEDDAKVKKFIFATIASLKPNEFVRSELQQYTDRSPIYADIYAVINSKGSWYIKFYLEHGRVTILSCHEPDPRKGPLVRVDGTKVKASL